MKLDCTQSLSITKMWSIYQCLASQQPLLEIRGLVSIKLRITSSLIKANRSIWLVF